MVQTSTSRSNTNGHALTLQALADAKRLPVEFVRDESGAVTKIIFHQPNGTFQAQREAE